VPARGFVKDFADRVRELRVRRGISQEELAFRAGLHRTAISFIERAKRSATLETIERLAIGLEVEPAQLMPALRGKPKHP
jgi:transcriptional regulator with XRE-family HTH domain